MVCPLVSPGFLFRGTAAAAAALTCCWIHKDCPNTLECDPGHSGQFLPMLPAQHWQEQIRKDDPPGKDCLKRARVKFRIVSGSLCQFQHLHFFVFSLPLSRNLISVLLKVICCGINVASHPRSMQVVLGARADLACLFALLHFGQSLPTPVFANAGLKQALAATASERRPGKDCLKQCLPLSMRRTRGSSHGVSALILLAFCTAELLLLFTCCWTSKDCPRGEVGLKQALAVAAADSERRPTRQRRVNSKVFRAVFADSSHTPAVLPLLA